MENTTATNGKGNVQPALIFIPDISGFTEFVTNTEISHSQHIISELLEIMVEANDIGMKVSEIEGDAILFYRFGKAPTAAELLAQVQRMFIRFHAHLKKYHTHRICNCGACKTATNLTLKFVAHYGEITMNTVKQHNKLFGKDVIVAHRLLKNDIEHHEYALITHDLVSACPQWVDLETIAWSPLQQSEQTYDSGKAKFCYLPLAALMEHVPEPVAEDYSISGVRRKIIGGSIKVEAPIDMVFSVIADLPWRNAWVAETEPATDINHQIMQVGSTHRCLANSPVQVSHDFEISPDKVTFTETHDTRKFCTVYIMEKLDANSTMVHANFFIKKNFLVELMFKMFMKKKYQRLIDGTFANLKNYCEGLVQKGEDHPYRIVLESNQATAA